MGQSKVIEFDQQVKALLSPFARDGMLPLQVTDTLTWGKPATGEAHH